MTLSMQFRGGAKNVGITYPMGPSTQTELVYALEFTGLLDHCDGRGGCDATTRVQYVRSTFAFPMV